MAGERDAAGGLRAAGVKEEAMRVCHSATDCLADPGQGARGSKREEVGKEEKG